MDDVRKIGFSLSVRRIRKLSAGLSSTAIFLSFPEAVTAIASNNWIIRNYDTMSRDVVVDVSEFLGRSFPVYGVLDLDQWLSFADFIQEDLPVLKRKQWKNMKIVHWLTDLITHAAIDYHNTFNYNLILWLSHL